MYEAIVETILLISQNGDRTWNSCASGVPVDSYKSAEHKFI